MLTARPRFDDDRGSFTKILGEDDCGDERPFVPREVFWSRSHRGVFRGMHVQLPPRATRKLVFVTSGRVRDVILDLRVGSPTYLTVWDTELDALGGGLVIPAGCAHGFEVLSDDASMVYLQEDVHVPECDSGILYSSAGITLTTTQAIVSERDLALPPLDSFTSPFTLT